MLLYSGTLGLKHNPGLLARLAAAWLVPARVQGDTCPGSVAHGLRLANDIPGIDLIVVGRGGGSMEDLWGFNDEALVRAVRASKTPVISAVGHQTDFTLCDFAADKRRKNAKFFRIINEVPTVLMILIVILVVVKPF